jgi:hypothetical protein
MLPKRRNRGKKLKLQRRRIHMPVQGPTNPIQNVPIGPPTVQQLQVQKVKSKDLLAADTQKEEASDISQFQQTQLEVAQGDTPGDVTLAPPDHPEILNEWLSEIAQGEPAAASTQAESWTEGSSPLGSAPTAVGASQIQGRPGGNPWMRTASWVVFMQALGKISASFAQMIQNSAKLNMALINAGWSAAQATATSDVAMGAAQSQELLSQAQMSEAQETAAITSAITSGIQAAATIGTMAKGYYDSQKAVNNAQATYTNDTPGADKTLLDSPAGQDWQGKFLTGTDPDTVTARNNWLNSDEGQNWLNTNQGQSWLKNTSMGKDFALNDNVPSQDDVNDYKLQQIGAKEDTSQYFKKPMIQALQNGQLTNSDVPGTVLQTAKERAFTSANELTQLWSALGSASTQSAQAYAAYVAAQQQGKQAQLKTLEAAQQAIKDLAQQASSSMQSILGTNEQAIKDIVDAFHGLANLAQSIHIRGPGGGGAA